MDQHIFTNMLRSLFNIDGYQLPELTSEHQDQFLRDPVRYFIGTDKAQQAAIFREVMKRQPVDNNLAYLEREARRFANMYPQGTDGRNTFVIFADKIASCAQGDPLEALNHEAPKSAVVKCECGKPADTKYDGDDMCRPCAAYCAQRDFEEGDMPGGFGEA